MVPDRRNDVADRRSHIIRRFKIHIVSAMDNNLLAVG